MEYELKFNDNGKLQGFQHIHYELQGMKMWETHYIGRDGIEHDDEFNSMVYDPRLQKSYFFRGSDWGTVEICRDAAEQFAVSGMNVVMVPEKDHWIMKPMTEEAFV